MGGICWRLGKFILLTPARQSGDVFIYSIVFVFCVSIYPGLLSEVCFCMTKSMVYCIIFTIYKRCIKQLLWNMCSKHYYWWYEDYADGVFRKPQKGFVVNVSVNFILFINKVRGSNPRLAGPSFISFICKKVSIT